MESRPSSSVKLIALAVGSALAALANANPVLDRVVAGQVSLGQPSSAVLNVINSPGAIINWRAFSIQSGETTRFIQQSANSAVLNRVTGADASAIFGQLLSNGRVYLVNPNGVVFGKGAVVDTAGLVASSLNISDDDFLNNRRRFSGSAASGAVTNYGHINGHGGSVYLIGPEVGNYGLIESQGGQVALAAGRSLVIGDTGLDGVQFEIQAPTDKALNLGTLRADDGAVGMFAGTLQQSGVIQANAVTHDAGGQIMLVASDRAAMDGTASATGSIGGGIEVLGKDVSLGASARLNVSGARGGGVILVGGDYQGRNAAISNATRTEVNAGARLTADATESGNGGKVVVWSDQHTVFSGSISARGGAGGGDGGQVEVSGKLALDFGGQVDTLAPLGKTGNLLLDPYDIYVIQYGGQVASDGANAAYLANNSLSIAPSTLANLNTDVTLAASHDIGFYSSLSLNNHALSATAGNDILVNAVINTHGGALSLSAGGNLYTYAALSSGNMTLTSGGDLSANAALTAGGNMTLTSLGSLEVRGTLTSTAGDMDLSAGSSLKIYNDLVTQGGKLSLTSTGDSVYLGGTAGTSTITTNGGDLVISAGHGKITSVVSNQSAGRINTSNGNLTLTAQEISLWTSGGSASGAFNVGSGNVSLTATAGDVWFGLPCSDCSRYSNLTGTGTVAASATGSVGISASGPLKIGSATAGGDELLLIATGNLSNVGLISGANQVTLYAGGTLSNTGTKIESVEGNVQLAAVGDITPGTVSASLGSITVTSYTGSIIGAASVAQQLTAYDVSLGAEAGSIGSSTQPIHTVTSSLSIDAGSIFYVDNGTNSLDSLTITANAVGTSNQSKVLAGNLSAFDLEEISGDLQINSIVGSSVELSIRRPSNSIAVGSGTSAAGTIQLHDSTLTLEADTDVRIADSGSASIGTINLTGASSAIVSASTDGNIQALSSSHLSIVAPVSVSLSAGNIGYYDGSNWAGPIVTDTANLVLAASGDFIVDNPATSLDSLSVTTGNSFNVALVGAPNLPPCASLCSHGITSSGWLELTQTSGAVSLPDLSTATGLTGGFSLITTDGDIGYVSFSGSESGTINSTAYTDLFPGSVTLVAQNGQVSGGSIHANGDVTLYGSSGISVSADLVASGKVSTLWNWSGSDGDILIEGDINVGGTASLQTYSGSLVLNGTLTADSDVTLYAGGLLQADMAIESLNGMVSATAYDSTDGLLLHNVTAADDISVADGSGPVRTGTLTSSGGSVTLSAATAVVGGISAAHNIDVFASSTFSSAGTLVAPNIVLKADGTDGTYGYAIVGDTSSTPQALSIDTGSGGSLTVVATSGWFKINNSGTLSSLSLTTNGNAVGSTNTSLVSSGGSFGLSSSGSDLLLHASQTDLSLSVTTTVDGIRIDDSQGGISAGSGAVELNAATGITQVGNGTAITTSGAVSLTASNGSIGYDGSIILPINLSSGIGAIESVSLTARGTTGAGGLVYVSGNKLFDALDITLTSAGEAPARDFYVSDGSDTLASFNRDGASGALLLTGGNATTLSGYGHLSKLSVTADADLSVTGSVNIQYGDLTLDAGGNLSFGSSAHAVSVQAKNQDFSAGGSITLDGSSCNVDVSSASDHQYFTASGGDIIVRAGAGHAAINGYDEGYSQSLYSGGDIEISGGSTIGAYAAINAGDGASQTLNATTGALMIQGGSAAGAYALLSAGNGQTLSAGRLSLTGGSGAAGVGNAAYAKIYNGDADQQISLTGDLSMASGAYGSASIINAGSSSGQTIVAANIYMQSVSDASATAADVKISAAGSQTVIASGDIILSNNHGDGAGLVSIDAKGGQSLSAGGQLAVETSGASAGTAQITTTGSQTIRAQYLEVLTDPSSTAGAATVHADGSQTVALAGGASAGHSLLVSGGGAGTIASVSSGGDQTIVVTAPNAADIFQVGQSGTFGGAIVAASGNQRLVATSIAVQAGDQSGANAEILASGFQAISTLKGGISVGGGAGGNGIIDPMMPTSAQTILSAGPVSVVGGSGGAATIHSGGTQVIETTVAGVTVGSASSGAQSDITASGSQTITAFTNVSLISGSGSDASAIITGSSVSVSAGGTITLAATANGLDSYAAIIATGSTATLTAGSYINLYPGTMGNNSDAYVVAGNGLGIVHLTAGSGCSGCVVLTSDPTLDTADNGGLWELASTVPSEYPDGLANLLSMYDYLILPGQEQDPDDRTKKLPVCQ